MLRGHPIHRDEWGFLSDKDNKDTARERNNGVIDDSGPKEKNKNVKHLHSSDLAWAENPQHKWCLSSQGHHSL